ncbi:MBL fold metallo-hydrolase [Aurantimonas sp. A2-1-M11]|uniref:MBL fold metallo-hydrolase n=1 Tax=Aurantimonas sp. A2-1-M11 TaxID=3113712 RepID=UPI002F93CBEC
MFTRRSFMVGATALSGSLAFGARGQAAPADRLSTLSDGHLELPADFLLPGVPAEARRELGIETGDGAMLSPPCNLTLHRSGDRLVLFDAGAGSNFMPSAGRLPDSLAEAGIDASEITDVIFTHAHPDHIWGVLDDFEDVAFPEAQFHVCRTEWDFWRSEAALANIPEERQNFVVGARGRFDAIEERTTLFDAGTEPVAGIEAMAAFGHTPGHCAFVLHGLDAPVMIVGDAIANDPVSFARPDLLWGADQDAEAGAATRRRLLDRLAAEKLRFVGFHLPQGGIGRVETEGSHYRFVPGA